MPTDSTKTYGKNSVVNGNVILIEPNDVNINPEVVNGISQYQDMYIFAELTAKSKGRTVIVSGNASSTDSQTVNFLGNVQRDESNPNNLNFTTNYYDGSTGDKTHYEGFGINNINIVINSSFIPQVKIQFVDIRGLAFFNQKDSPYRILFDFPPPIFTLTVKGYYGKAISYELHLVKYESEFSSANGNFIIDAQFVAVTFAPLTDILFRYVVNAPLINNRKSLTPNAGEPPANTFEFILKLRSLYKTLSDRKDTDSENKELNSIQDDIESIDNIFWMLNQYNKSEILEKGGKSLRLVIKSPKDGFAIGVTPATRASENWDLNIIENVEQYGAVIKTQETSGRKSVPVDRLLILYKVGSNLPLSSTDYNPTPNENIIPEYILKPFVSSSKNYKQFNDPLTEYNKLLMANNLPVFGIVEGDIPKSKPFQNQKDIILDEDVETEYYALDITNYYYRIYKKKNVLSKNGDEVSIIIADKINAMVAETLGMIPSIYNVFEIILNDVDTFFNILAKTSRDAEEKHNDPAALRIIADNNIDSPVSSGNLPDRIYSFPLVVKESTVHGGTKRERIAPIALSKNTEFPELDLVSDFIDTFLLQSKLVELYNARDNQYNDGTYKWIPISPFDSTLGGASPQSPYLKISDAARPDILKIFLKRFYMLTQGTLPESFYDEQNNSYSILYGNSEAVNLTSAFLTPRIAETVKVMVDEYLGPGGMVKFYTDIETLTDTYENATINLYNFDADTIEYFPITPTNPNNGRVYTDKNNENFVGVNMYNQQVVIQDTEESSGSDNPVDNFTASITNVKISGKLFKRPGAEKYYEFSEQNVIYFRDTGGFDEETEENPNDINGIITFTRFLYNEDFPDKTYTWVDVGIAVSDEINSHFPGNEDPVLGQQIAYQEGNLSFEPLNINPKKSLDYGRSTIKLWSKMLGKNDTGINETLTGTTETTQNLTNMLILSNFGFTMSPFNLYPNVLNTLVFDTPAAIEVPAFYAPYIGMLLTAIKDGWDDDILTFFTGTTGDKGVGSVLNNKGFFVLADLHDVANHLSVNDKNVFKAAYSDFSGELDDIRTGIIDLIEIVITNTGTNADGTPKAFYSVDSNAFNYFLNPTAPDRDVIGKGNYWYLIETVMEREGLINFTQITFSLEDSSENTYISLEELNNNGIGTLSGGDTKTINDNFFKQFFNRVKADSKRKGTELKDEEEALRKAKSDENIISQLYYSFKNINDKWLSGNENKDKKYPFNRPNKNLIDSFAFVDRGMNPIGETILNAEILIDLVDDPNASLFTVLTQLLSLNGFEFFPLQNFMSFNNNAWEDSFKIYSDGININTHTAFVCMYIGGSASYPSVASNGFVNDGIIDISEPGVADFSTKKPDNQNTVNDTQEAKNEDFPWREVRAFRVRFGEQNQSMFQDIKIDSKEYPETNESIQILSRLAGDNSPDAPVPIGQNLYNLYENRSYKATITGFGNAMIQPTQYFQLENVPLFNGAYIILSVEHNITANKMTTSFAGTRLLKFPVPRVLTPLAFTDHRSNLTPGQQLQAALASNNELTHYNSMYANNENALNIE